MGGAGASSPQLVPVHPVLARDQLLQGYEGFSQQQGVLPECTITKNPQVDHPLVQVTLRDPLIHQLTTTGRREEKKKRRGSGQLKFKVLGATFQERFFHFDIQTFRDSENPN